MRAWVQIADVLGVFHGSDADAVCHVLRTEFMMCWETLKPRTTDLHAGSASGVHAGGPSGDSRRPAAQDASAIAAKQSQELGELREKLESFESRLDGCIASLASVQEQTKVLPQMHAALRAIVEAHTPKQ